MEIKKYEELKDEFVPMVRELLDKIEKIPNKKEEFAELSTTLAEFGKAMANFAVGICILFEAKDTQEAIAGDYDSDVEQLNQKGD